METTPKFQLLLLAALVGVAIGWWVNGTYRNPCCADVVLTDGVMTTRGLRVGFTLEHMKFGMVAYPAQPVEIESNRVVARPNGATTSILFDDSLGSFTLRCRPDCAEEIVFSRF